jgi:hypothetical protein
VVVVVVGIVARGGRVGFDGVGVVKWGSLSERASVAVAVVNEEDWTYLSLSR